MVPKVSVKENDTAKKDKVATTSDILVDKDKESNKKDAENKDRATKSEINKAKGKLEE